MPIYEFQCPECSTRFEELVALGVSAHECPECGSNDAVRVLSQVSPAARMQVRGAAAKRGQSERSEVVAARGERIAATVKKRERGELPPIATAKKKKKPS